LKVLCSQDELARSLQIAVRAVPTKSTLPILSGLLLETRDDLLFCFGSDLEKGIEVKVPEVTIITPGRVVVSGKTFYDIIRHLPPGRIEMSVDEDGKKFNIKTTHSFFQLNLFSAEEYPALPEDVKTIALLREEKTETNEDVSLFSISSAFLWKAVKQTVYATAPEDSRPFLSSILWELSPNSLRLVGTDINRLVLKDLSVKCNFQNNILVPVNSMKEMATIFGNDPDDEIDFLLFNRQLYAVGNGVIFYTRLINAQFPRYEQVIPEDFTGEALLNREAFLSALTRNSLIDRAVKLSFSEGKVKIFSYEPDFGQSSEEVACSYEGKPMDIGFNAVFIMEFLRSVIADDVVFHLSEGMKASVLKTKNSEKYLYVLMPLRLNY
jgi:DNA polymerase-3 subunit beta